ncbi:hypothetical protein [Streptomyces sp. NPDC015125]|uniref:hypothetical protein n=1 Tax=Streptomyces sp. NPDC015125 TaxID=3364938 RepID=UPI003701F1C9
MRLSVKEATGFALRDHYGHHTAHPEAIGPALRLLGCLESLLERQQVGWFLQGALAAYGKSTSPNRPRTFNFSSYFGRALEEHFPDGSDINVDAAWQLMLTVHNLLDRRDSHFETFIRCAIEGWEDVAEPGKALVS